MWFRWMMTAFFFNGICTFGMRILAGRGLASTYTSTYLFLWYSAGALLLAFMHISNRLYLRNPLATKRVDLAVGIALGTASVTGQTFLGMALGGGLPGSVVYPIALAGGLFIVVGAGFFLFKERVGPYGVAGIALGLVSIILLSL
jgi:multidrug transporter EmrE-like cation transporter